MPIRKLINEQLIEHSGNIHLGDVIYTCFFDGWRKMKVTSMDPPTALSEGGLGVWLSKNKDGNYYADLFFDARRIEQAEF